MDKRNCKEGIMPPLQFISLSKKSGWSWAFSDRYGRMGKGDEECWNAGKWIEIRDYFKTVTCTTVRNILSYTLNLPRPCANAL